METQNSNNNIIITHSHDDAEHKEDYRFRIWSKLEKFKNAVDEQVATHNSHYPHHPLSTTVDAHSHTHTRTSSPVHHGGHAQQLTRLAPFHPPSR